MEGYKFALKELAEVEDDRDKDERADVSDESVLVRGRVPQHPVVVERVVYRGVPLHCYT